MPRAEPPPVWSSFALDPASPLSRQEQIAAHLRAAVLSGRLRAGARLPATRRLAADLGVARQTVVLAYDRLAAEGYLEGRAGAGTRVAAGLSETLPGVGRAAPAARPAAAPAPSRRGRALLELPVAATPPRAPGRSGWLAPGTPALDLFPAAEWERAARRSARSLAAPAVLDYGDPRGSADLRRAIADHYGAARGVAVPADRILVTSGSQQAISLCAAVLLDPGDRVVVEDPGYVAGRGALAAAGAVPVGVPVDGEGLDAEAAARLAPDARAVFATPSHQYPLGVVLSLARRLALVDRARASDGWILEDDYDGEFRYAGRPLPPLQSLSDEAARRTVYLGTFSKTLAPGLRLGFAAVPDGLVDAFARARALLDRQPPEPVQAALARFMAEGRFAAHLRRMRDAYRVRRDLLFEALDRARRSGSPLDPGPAPPDAGLHLAAALPDGADDAAAAREAARRGLRVPALSAFAAGPANRRRGLVIGYGGTPPDAIPAAAAALQEAVRAA
jgi:GntR family transcriptional regulator/MocR family aminotransferase